MEASTPTPVSQALTNLDISHREFKHPGPIHSLEQAAYERGQRPEQVVRSILFRLSSDQHVMVLVAGPKQVSWPLLRQYLGTNRISMAKEEEVLQVTGYVTGAVSPFGLPRPLRVIADPNVFEPFEISIGSGVRGTTIILRSEDLKKALGPVEVVPLTSQES
jgi:Cys-tRNA(Pro) deacylase